MYVRFVVGGEDEHHRLLTGLVTEARLLQDKGALSDHEEEFLESIYDWLNAHLPCPPFSTSGWSQDAVAWFKDGSTDAIVKMRDLAVLLQQHGALVRMLRSKNPGKVLYEDAYQVVVEEWKTL